MEKKSPLVYTIFMLIMILFLAVGCTPDSPRKIFEKTALNTNMVSKFGSADLKYLINQDPQIYDESTKKMIPSTYEDYFKFKISYLEKAYESIKKININDDNKEIVTASLALFAYVIPKEKEGYLQIAKLKDQKVSETEINDAIIAFDTSNSKEAQEKFDALIAQAKVYAQKHNLDVKFF